MMTPETAFELSRQRLAEVEQRATLAMRLGDLPKAAILPMFQREVHPITCVIEVHQNSDRVRIRRRLIELSASRPRSARKAS